MLICEKENNSMLGVICGFQVTGVMIGEAFFFSGTDLLSWECFMYSSVSLDENESTEFMVTNMSKQD